MAAASSKTRLAGEGCLPEADAVLRDLIANRNQDLLAHPFFDLCRSGRVSRTQLLEILKQLYCFSAFYEQLLQNNLPDSPPEPADTADDANALLWTSELCPKSAKTFTKAMFGYLSLALQGEHAPTLSIAVIFVMESVGESLFRETMRAAETHKVLSPAALSLAPPPEQSAPSPPIFGNCSREAFTVCRTFINDVYRLLSFVLDEWLGIDSRSHVLNARESRVKTLRLN